jgi:hypothetical protein
MSTNSQEHKKKRNLLERMVEEEAKHVRRKEKRKRPPKEAIFRDGFFGDSAVEPSIFSFPQFVA